jgi:PhzF family phenazine biosynthesis protein
MILPFFHIDAFADQPFSGNPAVVYPLAKWLPDTVLQAIAMEHNLSETAFFVPAESAYELRWFTPTTEVDMCGHATLASAYVLYEELGVQLPELKFYTRSGTLRVSRSDSGLRMDFPSIELKPYLGSSDVLQQALGLSNAPESIWEADDLVVCMNNYEELRMLEPQMNELVKIKTRGIIVTSRASEKGVDFVSRFFGPRVGVNEDPVTGSAHTKLAPFWSKQLNKTRMRAFQASKRGGYLEVECAGDRVIITGKARRFSRGETNLPQSFISTQN